MADPSPPLGTSESGAAPSASLEGRPSLVPVEEPLLDDITDAQLFSMPAPPRRAPAASPELEEHALSRSGQVLAPGYVIQRLIDRGTMGRVYLAMQSPPGREVAVKCFTAQPNPDEFRARFAVEAQAAAKLTHRHIVTVHDYGETDGGELFLTMEYLRGEPISKVVAREGRLSSERVAKIGLQIARALRAAHRQGVVHRDLEPSNVMLLNDEDHDLADFIKVLDFGLVKAFSRGADQADPGTWLGSPAYMSPEQIRRKEADPRSDLYSLGAILFHALAGRPPFAGATSVEVFSQQLRDPVPWMRDTGAVDVAPELEVVVRRCLEKDPARRYQSTDDLIADLKAALRLIEGTSGISEPPTAQTFGDPSETSLPGTVPTTPRAPRPSLVSLEALAAEAGVADGVGVASEALSGPPEPAPPPPRNAATPGLGTPVPVADLLPPSFPPVAPPPVAASEPAVAPVPVAPPVEARAAEPAPPPRPAKPAFVDDSDLDFPDPAPPSRGWVPIAIGAVALIALAVVLFGGVL